MLDIHTLIDLRKKAICSIKTDCDDVKISSKWKKTVFIVVFYILPVLAAIATFYNEIKLTDLQGYIGTSIAIFTGLFFSLLLNIGTKIKAEKQNKDKDSANFQQYKTSMKQIADITLYTIVLGIYIFILMLINSIFKTSNCVYIEFSITSVTIFMLVRFIGSLFFMIQRFFYLIRDEISNIL